MGLDLAMQVAAEYDREIFKLLLLIIYNNLTLTSINVEHVGSITLAFSVSGALASTKEVDLWLLQNKLSLFRKTTMPAITLSPFTWWVKHE